MSVCVRQLSAVTDGLVGVPVFCIVRLAGGVTSS
jgi:hypothetical protein